MARFDILVATKQQCRSIIGKPGDKVTRHSLSALDKRCGGIVRLDLQPQRDQAWLCLN